MKSILIVEDSNTVRSMVAFVLKDDQLIIDEAEDGEQALSKAQEKRYDLVITDHNMPNMSGLELSQALRDMPEYRSVPILMLTTESDPHLKRRGKELDLTGWVLKPLSPDRFKPAIEKLLNR